MILITGASKGIGLELLHTYVNNNQDVIGSYNTHVPSTYLELYTKVDVTNFKDIYKWINKYDLNNITLINCAGINYDSFLHKSDADKWKHVIDVNLIGTYNTIKEVLPLMREQKYGRIINIGSILADKGMIGTSAYSASKSALKGLINAISIENISYGITINNIELGYTKYGMSNEVSKELLPKELCDITTIYNTIEYLRNNDYITGKNIKLNR